MGALRYLALVLLLAACTPAAAECVADYHSLPSDHGYRRYRIVDGRHCWYLEGARAASRASYAAAPLDKTARLFVQPTSPAPLEPPAPPSAPPMIVDPPPPAPTAIASLVDEVPVRSPKGNRLAPARAPDAVPIPDTDHRIGALAVAIAALLAVAIGFLHAAPRQRPPASFAPGMDITVLPGERIKGI
jgi:hypothetical protein